MGVWCLPDDQLGHNSLGLVLWRVAITAASASTGEGVIDIRAILAEQRERLMLNAACLQLLLYDKGEAVACRWSLPPL